MVIRREDLRRSRSELPGTVGRTSLFVKNIMERYGQGGQYKLDPASLVYLLGRETPPEEPEKKPEEERAREIVIRERENMRELTREKTNTVFVERIFRETGLPSGREMLIRESLKQQTIRQVQTLLREYESWAGELSGEQDRKNLREGEQPATAENLPVRREDLRFVTIEQVPEQGESRQPVTAENQPTRREDLRSATIERVSELGERTEPVMAENQPVRREDLRSATREWIPEQGESRQAAMAENLSVRREDPRPVITEQVPESGESIPSVTAESVPIRRGDFQPVTAEGSVRTPREDAEWFGESVRIFREERISFAEEVRRLEQEVADWRDAPVRGDAPFRNRIRSRLEELEEKRERLQSLSDQVREEWNVTLGRSGGGPEKNDFVTQGSDVSGSSVQTETDLWNSPAFRRMVQDAIRQEARLTESRERMDASREPRQTARIQEGQRPEEKREPENAAQAAASREAENAAQEAALRETGNAAQATVSREPGNAAQAVASREPGNAARAVASREAENAAQEAALREPENTGRAQEERRAQAPVYRESVQEQGHTRSAEEPRSEIPVSSDFVQEQGNIRPVELPRPEIPLQEESSQERGNIDREEVQQSENPARTDQRPESEYGYVDNRQDNRQSEIPVSSDSGQEQGNSEAAEELRSEIPFQAELSQSQEYENSPQTEKFWQTIRTLVWRKSQELTEEEREELHSQTVTEKTQRRLQELWEDCRRQMESEGSGSPEAIDHREPWKMAEFRRMVQEAAPTATQSLDRLIEQKGRELTRQEWEELISDKETEKTQSRLHEIWEYCSERLEAERAAVRQAADSAEIPADDRAIRERQEQSTHYPEERFLHYPEAPTEHPGTGRRTGTDTLLERIIRNHLRENVRLSGENTQSSENNTRSFGKNTQPSEENPKQELWRTAVFRQTVRESLIHAQERQLRTLIAEKSRELTQPEREELLSGHMTERTLGRLREIWEYCGERLEMAVPGQLSESGRSASAIDHLAGSGRSANVSGNLTESNGSGHVTVQLAGSDRSAYAADHRFKSAENLDEAGDLAGLQGFLVLRQLIQREMQSEGEVQAAGRGNLESSGENPENIHRAMPGSGTEHGIVNSAASVSEAGTARSVTPGPEPEIASLSASGSEPEFVSSVQSGAEHEPGQSGQSLRESVQETELWKSDGFIRVVREALSQDEGMSLYDDASFRETDGNAYGSPAGKDRRNPEEKAPGKPGRESDVYPSVMASERIDETPVSLESLRMLILKKSLDFSQEERNKLFSEPATEQTLRRLHEIWNYCGEELEASLAQRKVSKRQDPFQPELKGLEGSEGSLPERKEPEKSEPFLSERKEPDEWEPSLSEGRESGRSGGIPPEIEESEVSPRGYAALEQIIRLRQDTEPESSGKGAEQELWRTERFRRIVCEELLRGEQTAFPETTVPDAHIPPVSLDETLRDLLAEKCLEFTEEERRELFSERLTERAQRQIRELQRYCGEMLEGKFEGAEGFHGAEAFQSTEAFQSAETFQRTETFQSTKKFQNVEEFHTIVREALGILPPSVRRILKEKTLRLTEKEKESLLSGNRFSESANEQTFHQLWEACAQSLRDRDRLGESNGKTENIGYDVLEGIVLRQPELRQADRSVRTGEPEPWLAESFRRAVGLALRTSERENSETPPADENLAGRTETLVRLIRESCRELPAWEREELSREFVTESTEYRLREIWQYCGENGNTQVETLLSIPSRIIRVNQVQTEAGSEIPLSVPLIGINRAQPENQPEAMPLASFIREEHDQMEAYPEMEIRTRQIRLRETREERILQLIQELQTPGIGSLVSAAGRQPDGEEGQPARETAGQGSAEEMALRRSVEDLTGQSSDGETAVRRFIEEMTGQGADPDSPIPDERLRVLVPPRTRDEGGEAGAAGRRGPLEHNHFRMEQKEEMERLRTEQMVNFRRLREKTEEQEELLNKMELQQREFQERIRREQEVQSENQEQKILRRLEQQLRMERMRRGLA